MTVLELSNEKARTYFMDPQCYGSTELPPYFDFSRILSVAEEHVERVKLSNAILHKASDVEGVNYTLVDNKDGKYAWRPLQFIHPFLYAKLCHEITTLGNWALIQSRFSEFAQIPTIHCASYPLVKIQKPKIKAEQILGWWSRFEQQSLILAMRYRSMLITDVTDCYGSIYTHSIAWALHGKEVAKQNRTGSLLGNKIDRYIRSMRYGQTNGIPQGSVLMDFIAEIVLGSIDECLYKKLDEENIHGYAILRYRDDYRIFVNDTSIGEKVLKTLTLVLAEYGMRFNSAKTKMSADIVRDSIKADKVAWFSIEKNYETLTAEKKLLLLYDHASRFPNAGSVMKPLVDLPEAIKSAYFGDRNQISACISISTELAYRNPRCYQLCMAVVAQLLDRMDVAIRREVAMDILAKFGHLPNTGSLQLWLQRIMIPCGISLDYSEALCKCVENIPCKIWENGWLEEEPDLVAALESAEIVNNEVLRNINTTMSDDEINLFIMHYQENYQG